MREFHAAGEGSHTSMPMPDELEGAEGDASAKPGPTTSFTRHMSAAAVGGVPVVPDSASASPCLNDFTSTTLVFASGAKAVFIVSSQASSVGAGGGAGGVGAGAGLSPPPQAATSTPADPTAQAQKSWRTRRAAAEVARASAAAHCGKGPMRLSPVLCAATCTIVRTRAEQ